MITISRVAATAKLSKIKGNIEARDFQADVFGKNLLSFILDTFESQSKKAKKIEFSQEEIQDYFKKSHPNIDVKVEEFEGDNYSSILYSNFEGEKEISERFNMCLPFFKNQKGQNVLNTYFGFGKLFHEYRHLSDKILNPKIDAKTSIVYSSMSEKKSSDAMNFYDKVIYRNELKKSDDSFSDEARAKRIKVVVNRFFEKNNYSANEKTAILQDWRHGVMTEINANKDEFNLQGQLLLHVESKNLDKNKRVRLSSEDFYPYDSSKIHPENRKQELAVFISKKTESDIDFCLNKHFFYPAKLDIINVLLKDEIEKQRIVP